MVALIAAMSRFQNLWFSGRNGLGVASWSE
jgi:hypothetical protein